MAVKRATTTRRPASSAGAGKSARGPSAKRPLATKAGKPRAAKPAATARSTAAAKQGVAKRPTARPGAAQPSRAKSKTAVKTGVARPTAKKSVAGARSPAVKAPKSLSGTERVVQVVEGALDEMKAVQVKVLDVRQLTDFADTLVIASGNSDRHVRSIAERVVEHAKKVGLRAMGIEGLRDGEWVLVDLQDVIVHVMLPRIRELYRLEDLWDVSAARREAASDKVAV